jgi:hypothetical protein
MNYVLIMGTTTVAFSVYANVNVVEDVERILR